MRKLTHINYCSLAQTEHSRVHRNSIVDYVNPSIVGHRKAVEDIVFAHADGVSFCTRECECVAVMTERTIVGNGVTTELNHVVAAERSSITDCYVTTYNDSCLVDIFDARAA